MTLGTNVVVGHETWARMVMLLGRHGFRGVPRIIAMTVRNVLDVEYLDLESLLESVKLQDSVQNKLPRYLLSSLNDEASVIRSQAVDLLMRLFNPCAFNYCQPQHLECSELLARTHDMQLISRLADIAIKDDDSVLKKDALALLKSAFHQTRFEDLVKSSLSELLEATFKNPDLIQFRSNAIAVLHDLTDPKINGTGWLKHRLIGV
ncbi:hypothetical protein FA13DRAFT_511283 [Coprinellus micaceus]|uniref:TATA-binding protein interacting (TIP20) domain-containing protein n=1 Tax=Coprinellus micaceus TaxID=71717 RepID=A0A4Y7SCD7_COPMI|nr:hypothetical protein FA13DRAFT_511283 [Coprinellus micaceus]